MLAGITCMIQLLELHDVNSQHWLPIANAIHRINSVNCPCTFGRFTKPPTVIIPKPFLQSDMDILQLEWASSTHIHYISST